MVNRYITALLVVLAATGMEAQTYQQALKFALTDISYDEFIQQPEAKALEDDILYVIKAIKEASQDEKKADFLPESQFYACYLPLIWHKPQPPFGSIVIRGPNCL